MYEINGVSGLYAKEYKRLSYCRTRKKVIHCRQSLKLLLGFVILLDEALHVRVIMGQAKHSGFHCFTRNLRSPQL